MRGLDETEVRVLRSCASTEDNFDTFADDQRMHRRGLVAVSIVVIDGTHYARYEITELGRLALRVNHLG